MNQPKENDAVLGRKDRKNTSKPQFGDLVIGGSEQGQKLLEEAKEVKIIQEAFKCSERDAKRIRDSRIQAVLDGLPGAGLVTQAEINVRRYLYGE